MNATSSAGLVATAILLCCASTPLPATAARPRHGDVQSRQKRYLVFPPYTHFIELILGFGLPITVGQQSLTLGPSLKYIYQLPYNGTQFTQPYVTSAKREVSSLTSRWLWYSALEQALDRWEPPIVVALREAGPNWFGLDGRACLLRMICESAEAPVMPEDIMAELMHIFLTPSTSDEAADSSGREFRSAEAAGSLGPRRCGQLYRECGVSLLGLVTQLELPWLAAG
ncbi:uncharacterized protein LOC134529343 [Bacillus rossius redtenbacheri]|uniref:uncharacterized protein LOC134529343 n=1 Tax=Bacillus rossius redtenbacheri TaxID=93214 RepID=UPI002FDDD5E4